MEKEYFIYIYIHFNQHDKADSWHRKEDTWFGVSIYGFIVGNNGEMLKKDEIGGYIVWKTDDFAITKFSFKFVEEVTRLMEKKQVFYSTIIGFSLFDVLNDVFKRRRIKVSKEVLKPLAGI